MSILQLIKNALGKLFGIWKDLSPEVKTAIISAIVKSFESIFRKFYQEYQEQNKEKQNV